MSAETPSNPISYKGTLSGLRGLLSKTIEDGLSGVVSGLEKMTSDSSSGTSKLKSLPIEQIYPNPEQPRQVFDPKALEDLAQTMKQLGQAQAITVKESANGYEIISGERRYRAAKLAGLTHLDCVIKDVNDQQARLLALVENVQREDLLPIEEAHYLKRILEENPEMTLESLAVTLGSHKSTLSEKIKLAEVPEDLQKHLHRKGSHFTHRHWRVLSRLENSDLLREYFLKAVEHQLSVVELERALETLGVEKRLKRKRNLADGTSGAATRQLTVFEEKDGKFRICSRNLELSSLNPVELSAVTQSVETLLAKLKSLQIS
jgi:ParB family chromosome partitioning protein